MPPADIVAALQQALLDGEACLQALMRERAGPDPSWQLAAALLLFGRQAGRLLGHGVRIRLHADKAVPPGLERTLLQSMQEILRWLLLQHEGAVEQLRRLRLPLATDIDIRIAPLPTAGATEAEEGCDVALQEGGPRSLPGSKAQQRLQRCLGPAVEQLQFDHTEPAGRRVTFRLSCTSLQRAQLQRYRGETAALQM